jgi:hypothetical protein
MWRSNPSLPGKAPFRQGAAAQTPTTPAADIINVVVQMADTATRHSVKTTLSDMACF